MRIEYAIEGMECLPHIPAGLAAVALVADILPLVWLQDAALEVETLDEDFLGCLGAVKQGYREIYPQMEFKGEIRTRAEKSPLRAGTVKAIQLFSGGVDAFFTLSSHVEEKPALLTIWGSDVYLKDVHGWENVWRGTQQTAHTYGLKACSVKSAFRSVLDEGNLEELVAPVLHDNWWHTMQHGIAILAHAAVPAWCLGAKTVYIASSYTPEFKGRFYCASDPRIDDHVRFAGAAVKHDGYAFDRQHKVYGICAFAREHRKQVPLRVCWQSTGGRNCGMCEKCCRTMCEILCAGENPADYGFEFADGAMQRLKSRLCDELLLTKGEIETFYIPLQKELRKNWDKLPNKNDLVWLRDLDFLTINDCPHKKRLAAYKKSVFYKVGKKMKKMRDWLTGMHF